MVRRVSLRAWLVALAVGACAPEAASPAVQVAAPVAATIRVTHVARDRFRVEYTFPQRARRLAFVHPSPTVRAHWRAASDEIRFVHSAAEDALIAAEPRSTWAIELDVDEVQPEKDYRPFYSLTDRGVLVYTGHFAAEPKESGSSAPERTAVVLRAAEGESVLVRGQPQGQEATLPSLPGTYAYFGTLTPIETRDFVGIVDHGYPPLLRARLDGLLPPLFAFFGDTLGRPASAAEKPLLLASFRALPDGDRDIGGGVIRPRLVQFGFGLAPRDDNDAAFLADIEHIVAHEVAHLWNTDLYSVPPGAEANTAWLREGAAEALALHALRRLGRIDEARYRERLSTALSLCLLSMAEGEPLSASTRPGHSRDFYDCGSTIALLTEGVLVARGKDLLGFYRRVFAGPADHYDTERYLTFLAEDDPTAAGFARRLANERLADPSNEIPAALRRVGIETKPADIAPAYEKQASAFAVRALVAPACLSALELRGDYGVTPRVTTTGPCGDRGDRLVSFDGVDLASRGASAFDAAYAQCTKEKTIEAGRKDKPPVRLPCVARARPPYLAVTRAP